LWLAAWSQRWFPDAFVFALIAILVVYLFGLLIGESPSKLTVEGGKSFWSLVPFTMQMAMIVITGFVLARSPPVHGVMQRLAGIPKTGRGAVAFVALFSMVTSLLSWGFSLIISGLLVQELSKRVKDMDYRAAAAAAYLGLGAVWALGLSSSAALMMATKSAIPPQLFRVSGLIPLTETLFTLPSLAVLLALILVSVVIAYWSAPSPGRAQNAQQMGVKLTPFERELPPRSTPGEWFEYSPVLTVLISALLVFYLVDVFRKSPNGALAALDLNTYNLICLVLGMLLHWRPRSFVRAVTQAAPGTGSLLLQFPFYAFMFGMIASTGISKYLAEVFVHITTQTTYPLLVQGYSAILGVFIPSGGSKWVIEAPYVLEAAVQHKVNLGWVVQMYNAAEALPNLVNPFWMLPLLAVVKLRARDLVGYSMLQMVFHIPVVLALCTLAAQLIPFVAPLK